MSKKCNECGAPTITTVGEHLYLECGLDDVTLDDVEKTTCTACGHVEVTITEVLRLHYEIGLRIAKKEGVLSPREVRFIRSHLGLTNQEFAKRMAVSEETASRWATGAAKISGSADMLLRFYAAIGPAFEQDDIEHRIVEKLGNLLRSMAGPLAMIVEKGPRRFIRVKREWQPSAADAETKKSSRGQQSLRARR